MDTGCLSRPALRCTPEERIHIKCRIMAIIIQIWIIESYVANLFQFKHLYIMTNVK
jgi:hypothetical protein